MEQQIKTAWNRKSVTVKDSNHYIGGDFVGASSGESFANIDPFTNQKLNSIALGDERDISKAVEAASVAMKKGPWGSMKVEERMVYINRIADLIDAEIEEIAHLEALDTGLPISQTKKMTARAAENFRFYARMVQSVLHGESYPVDNSFINYTVYKPIGVVGLITPWNAPFMLETWKVAPALATGNAVVLKPAELSPLTVNKLAEVIDRAGLPEGVFNVVHGYGETAGAALVAHKDVTAISFTGETTTGSTIIKNSADTLKKTSMELGGKSPLIVFEDANFDRALDAAVWGIFSFNGERCTANSRVFLHSSIKDRFIAAMKERVDNLTLGDSMDGSTQLGPLISKDHMEKVNSYISLAKEEGCEVYQEGARCACRWQFCPANAPFKCTKPYAGMPRRNIWPVVSVIEFEEEQEVIDAANDVEYGLAGYVWTSDLQRGHRVAQAVDAGMIWVNAQNVRDLRIPFGGMKASGIGREGGHYAMFEFYTEPKAIHIALGDHHIPQFGKK
ncbi:5-carboxymethyl-2-hydroxymuconate semialdehyde dehydrogenase [Bacillus sp. JCM 19041]|uniref:5-carboxymethyl-2-hydroxymuconate semialdehyde dehydrogenase n=1 Tax=Bacillus sp. JCM 19041 TaxID=1460637 RepID=UPI0009EB5062